MNAGIHLDAVGLTEGEREYRDDPTEGPTLTQFDQQFLHRHAMAWSADHRPN